MFDFSWSEIAVVGALALIVIGPKELPGALRAVGRWLRTARGLAEEFRGHFDQMLRESELADLRRGMAETEREITRQLTYDPPAVAAPETPPPLEADMAVDLPPLLREEPPVALPVAFVGALPEGLGVAALAKRHCLPVVLPHPARFAAQARGEPFSP